jgi:hypothetical protein
MTTKLTKTGIDKMAYRGDEQGNAWDVRWDGTLPGFGGRVYPTGRKAFILRYRVNGRQRLFTLGTYGPLTLDAQRGKS